MPSDDLAFVPATELVALIRSKRVSATEVVRAALDRIERLNPQLNAYCTVAAEQAIAAAKSADAAQARGAELGPLHGVPVSIKDMIATQGVRTTWGSRLFADYVPDYDAPVVSRLKAAGAIVLGKTNTPEFGHKGVTHNQVFGVTRNPWNLDHTPGGSSGGAGAAVAAGLGPLAVGTDGGGSVRIPASFSGIYGLKPNLGRVPQYPVTLGLEYLSHAGPMTRTVADAALLLDVLAGPDERDINSLPKSDQDFAAAAREYDIRGMKVAWSPTLGYATVDRRVAEITRRAVGTFEQMGCAVEQVDSVFEDPGDAWFTIFASGYAAARRNDLEKSRTILDPAFVSFIDRVSTKSAADLALAGYERRRLLQKMGELLSRFDILLTPSVAIPPLPIGMDNPETIDGKKPSLWGWIPFTYPFNMTGQPAASVPCGFTAEGLPVGLQIVGRRFDEATVLRVSAAYEAAAPWAGRRPPAPFN